MKRKSILTRIKSDIAAGENLDAYVGLVLGATLTILGVLGEVRQAWLDNFILLTLTFLVLVSLKNRYVLQDTQRFLPGNRRDASYALLGRSDYEPLEDRLSGARDVVVVGNHLLGFVGFNKNLIAEHARQGCKFTFVLTDPAQINLEETVRNDVNRSISTLEGISYDSPKNVSIRVTSKTLPFSIFAVDMNTPRGLIQIQPHEFFKETDLRVHFDLRASVGSKWYRHYEEQLELLLESSRVIV